MQFQIICSFNVRQNGVWKFSRVAYTKHFYLTYSLIYALIWKRFWLQANAMSLTMDILIYICWQWNTQLESTIRCQDKSKSYRKMTKIKCVAFDRYHTNSRAFQVCARVCDLSANACNCVCVCVAAHRKFATFIKKLLQILLLFNQCNANSIIIITVALLILYMPRTHKLTTHISFLLYEFDF